MDIKIERFVSLSALMTGLAEHDFSTPYGQLYFLAGGTDLLVVAKAGLIKPSTWFEISDIPELKGIEVKDGRVVIGSGVTHREINRSEVIRQYAPALAMACGDVGGPQIRARGTIGGNLGNASPAADGVTALYSLGTTVELACPRGRRSCPIEEFVLGPRRLAKELDEVIVAVSFPAREGMQGAWKALGQRKSLAISKVSLAVSAVKQDGAFSFVQVSLGSVGPTIVRPKRTEEVLQSAPLTEELIAQAQEVICQEVTPISDIRSTAEYRKAMCGVLLGDALAELLK